MPIRKYRKKPIVIEAVQWIGTNDHEVQDLIGEEKIVNRRGNLIVIRTLEGDMIAQKGDYIIKGVEDEAYPCRETVFFKTYESINTNPDAKAD